MRICVNFYGTLVGNKKVTYFGSKLDFFKKTPLWWCRGLFIILTNPKNVLCIKIKQSSENSRESLVRDKLSNIQLMNKKFGSNIDEHMKEYLPYSNTYVNIQIIACFFLNREYISYYTQCTILGGMLSFVLRSYCWKNIVCANSTALRCWSFLEKTLKKSTCVVMIRIIITSPNQIFL